ncbi:DUF6456 domain-containing protein [Sphingomonas sp.]|uniref:DUF6456 domain-containing protein n=1 Tax=Sphingomonas sp. TaxID=28214 RepID=UPI00286E3A19|nr:DUF6456 domain-containing protein [Sphingomonas sp.]
MKQAKQAKLAKPARLLAERAIGDVDDGAAADPRRAASAGHPLADAAGRARPRPARSVTVNLADSPLGWLRARGLVSLRQFDAGERLRGDYQRSALPPSITMSWTASPVGSRRGGAAPAPDLSAAQLDARRRFDDAIAFAGPGLSDILWRVVCAGEGMRDAESALGWPARAGRLVLGLALDRLAVYYRIG